MTSRGAHHDIYLLSRQAKARIPCPHAVRPSNIQENNIFTTRKGILDMNTKEKNLPVSIEDGIDNEFHAPGQSEYSGELSVGPVNFRSSSKGSDNSGSIIGGVLAGGAVAIGAVAVTLTLLGASRNS